MHYVTYLLFTIDEMHNNPNYLLLKGYFLKLVLLKGYFFNWVSKVLRSIVFRQLGNAYFMPFLGSGKCLFQVFFFSSKVLRSCIFAAVFTKHLTQIIMLLTYFLQLMKCIIIQIITKSPCSRGFCKSPCSRGFCTRVNALCYLLTFYN